MITCFGEKWNRLKACESCAVRNSCRTEYYRKIKKKMKMSRYYAGEFQRLKRIHLKGDLMVDLDLDNK